MEKYETKVKYIECRNIEKTIKTNIVFNNDQMYIKGEELEYIMQKKVWHRHPQGITKKIFNPFLLGERTIDIENITSIKIENRRVFGYTTIVLLTIGIFFLFFMIYLLLNSSTNYMDILIPLPALILYIYLLSALIFEGIELYKFKSLKIILKNEKNICIPVEGWMCQEKNTLQNFIYEMQNVNSKIKVKNIINRNKLIMVFIFMLSIIAVFADMKYNISNNIIDRDSYNIDVNVYEAKLIRSNKINYINTYFIEEINQNIKIKENIFSNSKDFNKKYYILSTRYYSKQNNKLIKTEYDTSSFFIENQFVYFSKSNIQYWYDFNNKRLYKFYDPQYEHNNSPSGVNNFSYVITPYNKNKKNENDKLDKIYKFIYVDKNNDLQIDNINVNQIKTIDIFNSKYGKCYIISNGNLYKKMYYMYMENSNINSDDDYDGIFLIYNNNSLLNDNKAIEYFKEVINKD